MNNITLKEIPFSYIQHYLVDFQKHSHCLEMPPDNSEIFGIYNDQSLVGYFIILGYQNGALDIIQGYLNQEARHQRLPKVAMTLLEQMAKRKGFKTIYLQTYNRFKSYLRFANSLGYNPQRLIFAKNLGE